MIKTDCVSRVGAPCPSLPEPFSVPSEAGQSLSRGVETPQIGGASAAANALSAHMVGEASVYVQGESLKTDATLPI